MILNGLLFLLYAVKILLQIAHVSVHILIKKNHKTSLKTSINMVFVPMVCQVTAWSSSM